MSLVVWAAVYTADTPHLTHVHESSVVSGSYYSQVPTHQTNLVVSDAVRQAPSGTAPIVFMDPRGGQPMHNDAIQVSYSSAITLLPLNRCRYYSRRRSRKHLLCTLLLSLQPPEILLSSLLTCHIEFHQHQSPRVSSLACRGHSIWKVATLLGSR